MLDSGRLEAFLAVAAEQGYLGAARRLGLPEPVIRERVQRLERDVGAPLISEAAGLMITEAGQSVLAYAREREARERDMIVRFAPTLPSGRVLRIAGYSSVVRSVLIPILTPLVRRSDDLVVHCFSRELNELPHVLHSGEADLIVADSEIDGPGLVNVSLGHEYNVLVEARGQTSRVDCFLDHDPEDTMTKRFFELNNMPFENIRRTFMDDIYGILDGVYLGWGRAVASAHLIESFPGLRQVTNLKPLLTPVFLVYREASQLNPLHSSAIGLLQRECARHMEP